MAYLFNTVSHIHCEVQGCNADFAYQADMQRHAKAHHRRTGLENRRGELEPPQHLVFWARKPPVRTG